MTIRIGDVMTIHSAQKRAGDVTHFMRFLEDGLVALHARTHPSGGFVHGNGEPVELILSLDELKAIAGMLDDALRAKKRVEAPPPAVEPTHVESVHTEAPPHEG